MNIKVLSQSLIEKYAEEKHDTPAILISICSHRGSQAKVTANKKNNIQEVLFLRFDDDDSPQYGIQESDGVKIREFLEENVPKLNVHNIIVNCEAGQSRSAGVAAALMYYFNHDDMPIFGAPRYTPNMRCYRTVLNEMMYNCTVRENR